MTRDAQAAWLLSALIPPGVDSHGLMNPPGSSAGKYMVRRRPLTPKLIKGALDGATRRPEVDGRQRTCTVSLAGILRNANGEALAAAIDVDDGGQAAVNKVLEVCQRADLWAFASLSEGAEHSGGHVWIPFDRLTPAEDLLNLARRLQAAAGVRGEAWPTGQLLRLPLQMHLHASGGPRRFQLLLQDGEVIDATDPWVALTKLQTEWRPNSPTQLADADRALPPLTIERRQPLHKSKVNPASTAQVVTWFNAQVSIDDLLATIGLHVNRLGAYHCPWHDDRDPSLVVWRHNRTGRLVCRCYSQHSGCPAADVPFLDSFNLAQLPGMDYHGLTDSEAVKAIAERYGLGRPREFRVTEHVAPTPPAPDALQVHERAIQAARAQLAEDLTQAKDRRSTVTVLKATPGLGKTHAAADLANAAHAAGQTVNIAIGRLDHADEWTRRLDAPFVWKARARTCECQDRAALEEWTAKGYTLPRCEPWCPYERQKAERIGRQVIYQYPHLVIDDGRLLEGADLLIVDESPLDTLLQADQVEPGDVGRLAATLGRLGDPGAALAVALSKTLNASYHAPLDGGELVQALAQRVGDVRAAVRAAQASPFGFGNPHPLAPDAEVKAPALLPRQWWGRFLQALAHDAAHPNFNPLVGWGGDGEAWRLTWYERGRLLGGRRLDAPAIIVLDGSASEVVARQLYAPWPVEFVQIDAPPSPTVRVVQATAIASTRRAYDDASRVDAVARQVATVCNELDLTLDGGLCYLRAAPQLAARLGGTWLHYGGQRGTNVLENAKALAIVASPTARPDAVLRKAQALWCDAPRLEPASERVGVGAYRYADPRLQAVADLAGPEELRQAAHRARPILSTTPTTLLIFSPWDLTALSLPPSTTIAELPHGNAKGASEALARYQARALTPSGGLIEGDSTAGITRFSNPEKIREADSPQIEKSPDSCTDSPPPYQPQGEEVALPAPVWLDGRLHRQRQGDYSAA